jgi:dynein heavy chain
MVNWDIQISECLSLLNHHVIAGHIISQCILESAIKITYEPPTGMQANLHKALDNFNQYTLEMCAKETEIKVVLICTLLFPCSSC